jgi:hypothetical protein
VLERKLSEKDINYDEITDINKMLSMEFESVPILDVNEKVMNYTEAIEWIKNYKLED